MFRHPYAACARAARPIHFVLSYSASGDHRAGCCAQFRVQYEPAATTTVTVRPVRIISAFSGLGSVAGRLLGLPALTLARPRCAALVTASWRVVSALGEPHVTRAASGLRAHPQRCYLLNHADLRQWHRGCGSWCRWLGAASCSAYGMSVIWRCNYRGVIYM